jgi:hypothetical protein
VSPQFKDDRLECGFLLRKRCIAHRGVLSIVTRFDHAHELFRGIGLARVCGNGQHQDEELNDHQPRDEQVLHQYVPFLKTESLTLPQAMPPPP